MQLRKWLRATSVPIAAAILIAACGSTSGSSAGTSGPIKIGSMNTLSGPLALPGGNAGAAAAFSAINASGGIHGRKIQYTHFDDGGSASTAVQDARQLLSKNVVANVGSLSLPDCTADQKLYAQAHVVTIGIGLDPSCYADPNWASLSPGPMLEAALELYYAYHQAPGHTCYFGINEPGSAKAYATTIRLLQTVGAPIHYSNFSQGQNDPPTPGLLKTKSAGCRKSAYSGPPPAIAALVKAAQAQNIPASSLLTASDGYDQSLIPSMGAAGNGLYTVSDAEPFTEAGNSAVAAYLAVMHRYHAPVSSFSELGYESAEIMAEVLRSIHGPITAASVQAQLRKGTSYPAPLLDQPFVFGAAKTHTPNRAVKILQVKNGKFVVANGGKWVTLPASGSSIINSY